MFSYLTDQVCMSGLRVREHLSCIAEVDIEVAKLEAFLRTVRHGVTSRLTPDGMTRVCGEGVDLIRVAHEMIPKWFETGSFRALRHMHCNPILGILVIARSGGGGLRRYWCPVVCVRLRAVGVHFHRCRSWSDANAGG